jgi:hypothetical protein
MRSFRRFDGRHAGVSLALLISLVVAGLDATGAFRRSAKLAVPTGVAAINS